MSYIPIPTEFSAYEDIFVSFIIIISSIILAKIVYWIVKKYLLKFAAKTKTEVDDLILDVIHKPIYYIIILIGLLVAVGYVHLPPKYFDPFSTFISIVLILVVTWAISNVINILLVDFGKRLAVKTKTSIDNEAIPFLSKVIKILIYVFAFVIIMDRLKIQITPLVMSLGIVGFAVAFAAQDTLGNLLAGFSILIDRPFVRGDRIEMAGHIGEVVDIGLRSTKIKTLDHRIIVVPNSTISSTEVINYSLPDVRIKLKIPIGVAYGTDIEKVKEIALNISKNTKKILKDPEPGIYFVEFGDSSLNFTLIVWVHDFKDRLKVIDHINTELNRKFEEEGIEIPFPCRTVYMEKS